MKGRVWQRPGSKNWTVIIESDKGIEGKRKPVWFSRNQSGDLFLTKKAADTFMVDKVYEVQHGTYVDPSKISTGEWLDVWLRDYCKVGRKTRETRANDIRLNLKPRVGDIPLQKLTTEHVQQMINLWEETCAANTIKNRLTALKLALKQAVASGHLNKVVTTGVVLPSVKKGKVTSLTQDEMNKMIKVFDGHWLQPVVIVALTTGARRGELLALKWSSIDGTKLTIDSSVSQVGRETFIKGTKTEASVRTIEIPEMTLNVLKAHRKRQAELRMGVGPKWADNDLIFPRDDGTPRGPATVSTQFIKKAKAAGFPVGKAHLHVLRHTHATQLFANGATVKDVQERLGHANATVTANIYLHTLPGHDALAAQTIAGLLDCSAIADAQAEGSE